MSIELPDGTTLPSYLTVGQQPRGGGSSSLSDITLRPGEVVAAFSPTDPANRDLNTKNKQWVYVVNVSYRNGAGARSVVPYRCTVGDMFGGLGDHLRYTVRPTDASNKGAFSKGAQVLVLCANGDKSNALIVGAMRNSNDKRADPSDTFLDFQFNGVRASIDRDGALSLKVPGATKLDGSPADDRDASNKGTSVTFSKDGSIAISDGQGDTVTVSTKDKSISVTAGSHTTTVDSKWKLKAATVEVEAQTVTVNASQVYLGGDMTSINPIDGVVVGSGIDTFTGAPYFALGNTSLGVKAKK